MSARGEQRSPRTPPSARRAAAEEAVRQHVRKRSTSDPPLAPAPTSARAAGASRAFVAPPQQRPQSPAKSESDESRVSSTTETTESSTTSAPRARRTVIARGGVRRDGIANQGEQWFVLLTVLTIRFGV
jgi:hypothetical protein